MVGFSSYIWNWEYNKLLAQKLREAHPNVFIIFGGPQVPMNDSKLFETHLPFVDAVVVGEGEITFQKLLHELISGVTEFATPGMLLHDKKTGKIIATGPAERLSDLSSLPSPYPLGIFDNLLVSHPEYSFQASQETHRGCPYACTFCDWGSATMSRVRRFPKDRIDSEFEWMGVNGIDLIYNCDANYGLFSDDIELTRSMVSVKNKYGFPKKFRAAFAKNSNQRVFEIATLLNDSGMCKGITLSLQSTDSDVLQIIKRKNMKVNLFSDLVKQYRSAQIPTYTEIILGLPGETLETFCNGINELLLAGQHDSINIYHAMMLPNAELNSEKQRTEHQLETVEIPLLLLHGSPDDDEIVEKNEIIISTSTLKFEDWCSANKIAVVVQAFHCMNLMQKIAKGVHAITGISYTDFYNSVIRYIEETKSGPWRDLLTLEEMCKNVRIGVGSFDFGDRTFGELVWPLEEIFYLRCVAATEHKWVEDFLIVTFPQIPLAILMELIQFQNLSTISPLDSDASRTLRFDIPKFLDEFDSSDNWMPRLPNESNVQVRRLLYTDYCSLADYAREVVWYGRKGTPMEHTLEIA